MGLHFDQQKQAFRVQIHQMVDGERRRISRLLPKLTTNAQARAIHDKMRADLFASAHLPNQETGWPDYVAAAFSDHASWFHDMLRRSRRHAAARGRPHHLTESALRFICLRSAGRCEVTGIRFSTERLPGRSIHPFKQSLDRIDSSRGYEIQNCRLVLTAVNIAMSAWGEDVLREVAVGYVINRFCAPGLVSYLKKTTV
jgi:hypothetical protein